MENRISDGNKESNSEDERYKEKEKQGNIFLMIVFYRFLIYDKQNIIRWSHCPGNVKLLSYVYIKDWINEILISFWN